MIRKREKRFNTIYDREVNEPESNKGKLITESSGYIPVEKRIKNFLEAGAQLTAERQRLYDYDSAFDENGDLVIAGDDGIQTDEHRSGEVLDFLESATKAKERIKSAKGKKTQSEVVEPPTDFSATNESQSETVPEKSVTVKD